ncbi:hypothetical protein [Acinetobacter sp.]|uniref:hypothetical protein n=1 Tax=Acinetobacter sp. TaxID=472 RepID=UPI00388F2CE4
MSIKKHRAAGYSFVVEEVPNQEQVWRNPGKKFYADYASNTVIFKMNIFYEKPKPAEKPTKRKGKT